MLTVFAGGGVETTCEAHTSDDWRGCKAGRAEKSGDWGVGERCVVPDGTLPDVPVGNNDPSECVEGTATDDNADGSFPVAL